MKRIKGFLYNNVPETSITILSILIYIICFGNIIAIGLFSFTILIFFVNYYRNKTNKKDWSYFRCSRSLILRKHVWINQKVNKNRDEKKCPQKEFVREMKKTIDSIPNGTKCYCCTHEVIKDHIIRTKEIQNVKYTYSHMRNIKRLKKQLRNERCKKCLSVNCNLLMNEKIRFYAVSFIKEKD